MTREKAVVNSKKQNGNKNQRRGRERKKNYYEKIYGVNDKTTSTTQDV